MNRALRHKIVHAVAAVGMAIAMAGFVWTFTGGPMLRNYAECGTVFLCR